MIDDRKSYLNGMECVSNGVKRYQILMYEKCINLFSNFDWLKSKFSQGVEVFMNTDPSSYPFYF